ncbi:MAG: [protein-PII] uridylyltransferase [Bacteroidetes bacterium]|nr:[protein-PII] uridylyltransferase [Bacteroidota bacterium]
MPLEISEIRALILADRDRVRAAHRAGADGWETCLALSQSLDTVLRMAFERGIPPALQSRCAVFATGGYGRCELCPHSDVDIMVLIDSQKSSEELHSAVKHFLHFLWDAGLDVGHSVRTLEDALALHGRSHDAWTAMLEARFLSGSKPLAETFWDALQATVGHRSDRWFIQGVFADMQARHDRFGSSVKLLEPNIKKSAGGLRDMHMVFWLHRGVDPAYLFRFVDDRPATLIFLERLQKEGELDADDVQRLHEALGFLFRTRHEMHYQRDVLNDTLEYALQRDVSAALGFGAKAELHSVEVFMAAYYRHARQVHSVHRLLSQRFREVIEPAVHPVEDSAVQLGPLQIGESRIVLKPGVRVLDDPEIIFEALARIAEQGIEPDFRLLGAIARGREHLTEEQRTLPALRSAFRRILRSGRAGRVLRTMNDLDLLGWFIPAFGDLVSFFQHNVYHYFTADEHTLIAIENAEKLEREQSPLGKAFRELPEREIMILTILLHDIAKPLGVADHEVTGVAVSRRVLEDLGMPQYVPAVGFLVRHHLIMEQTAFRRNVHDPATIREFAARFEEPELLDYLYVMTYADLSAVNISVWTQWKAAMLHDLYRRTADVLRLNLHGAEIDRYHRTRHEEAVAALSHTLARSVPPEEVAAHLEGMNTDAYQASFTPEEIAAHIEAGRLARDVTTLFTHRGGFTEVTVIARDAPFALSRFCAVLAANDANIFDANIFTRRDGIIIDRFRVSATLTRQQLDPGACDKIMHEMQEIVAGRIDVGTLFREHHRKWKRRSRAMANPNIRTGIEFEATEDYTIIDVYAPDSVGFLYRVTETISRLGLNIVFAKIATRVDGIVDSFYVHERTGGPVAEEARRAYIGAQILATVRSSSVLGPA